MFKGSQKRSAIKESRMKLHNMVMSLLDKTVQTTIASCPDRQVVVVGAVCGGTVNLVINVYNDKEDP